MFLSVVKKKKRRLLSVGEVVLSGKYTVVRVVASKGMSNVYKVEDNKLGKFWCLKEVVKAEAGRNKIEYRSILREADIMKRLNHSSIVRIVSIEEDEDSVFIVMDWVEGSSLSSIIQKKGIIPQEMAIKWSKQICGVLIYLHNLKNPIIYRDLKPDNIMIQRDDRNIKILDFGISEVLTSDNLVIREAVGTRGYAPREQTIVGTKYDLRSDIYSLGKTLYTMLSGLDPRLVEDLPDVRVVNPSVSIGVDVIIKKCVEEDPRERYDSVEGVLYALENYSTLDTEYRSNLTKKLKIIVSLFSATFLLCMLSIIPFSLNARSIDLSYEEKVSIAEGSGRTADYLSAIEIKPSILNPYLGLIDSYKVDGVFTKEEEEGFLGLLGPNTSLLKKDDAWGELAYSIGKLYWFYYEGEDGDIVSSKWFKEAMDMGYSYDSAKVLYDLGSFKKDIAMSIAESSDAGMYRAYWDNLILAKEVDTGEIVELQVYSAIADAINTYAYRLRVDGVSKESVDKEILGIGSFLNAFKPSSDRSKALYDNLSSVYSGLQGVVDVAYS